MRSLIGFPCSIGWLYTQKTGALLTKHKNVKLGGHTEGNMDVLEGKYI